MVKCFLFFFFIFRCPCVFVAFDKFYAWLVTRFKAIKATVYSISNINKVSSNPEGDNEGTGDSLNSRVS